MRESKIRASVVDTPVFHEYLTSSSSQFRASIGCKFLWYPPCPSCMPWPSRSTCPPRPQSICPHSENSLLNNLSPRIHGKGGGVWASVGVLCLRMENISWLVWSEYVAVLTSVQVTTWLASSALAVLSQPCHLWAPRQYFI